MDFFIFLFSRRSPTHAWLRRNAPLFCLLTILALPASGQTPDTTAQVEVGDPAIRGGDPAVGGEPDTTAQEAETDDKELSRHIRGATWRSAVLPGWGQIHNDQAIKAPFVVAVLAGATVFTIMTNNEYKQYQRAFRYIARENDDPTVPDPDNEYADNLDDWVAVGSPPANQTRDRRDDLRGRRDIMILVTTGVYALQILDAYVAAHLRNFDVGEDLSLGVSPTPEGPALGLRYEF